MKFNLAFLAYSIICVVLWLVIWFICPLHLITKTDALLDTGVVFVSWLFFSYFVLRKGKK